LGLWSIPWLGIIEINASLFLQKTTLLSRKLVFANTLKKNRQKFRSKSPQNPSMTKMEVQKTGDMRGNCQLNAK